MKYYLYHIVISGETVYVGRTTDLRRRQKQHRADFRKGVLKPLWRWWNERGLVEEDIVLRHLGTFKTRADSKRAEMMMILLDYIGEKKLIQKVPNISDR